jgi:hypothetical protein
MKLPVLMLGCLLAGAVAAEATKHEMWAWKDANGVTHYSDRPVPGARRIEIATMEPESVPTPPRPAAPGAPAAQAAPAYEYELLEIWVPENGESFFGADAEVTVRVRSEPELGPGHELRVYLDGKLVDKDPTTLDLTIGSIERGAHSLTALIVDDKGAELIRSEPRVFHIRQPSVINNPANVGPALKPKPRT